MILVPFIFELIWLLSIYLIPLLTENILKDLSFISCKWKDAD